MSEISIKVSTPGAEQAAEAIKKVGAAQDQLTTSSIRLNQSLVDNLFKEELLTIGLEKARAAQAKVSSATNDAAKSSGSAGTAVLQASQAFEDLQYGIGGAVNNIPGLVQSLGGTAGVAGVVSVASVLIVKLVQNFDRLIGKEKELAIQGLNSAEKQIAIANAVLQAMDAREEASKQAASSTELLAFSIRNSELVWRKELEAINESTSALKRRNQAQAEMDDAEKALKLAIIDSGAGTDTEKLEAKLAVEKEYRVKRQEQQKAELDDELASTQKQEDAAKRRAAVLTKQVEQYNFLTQQKKNADAEVKALERQQQNEQSFNVNLYRRAINLNEQAQQSGQILRDSSGSMVSAEKINGKFDPSTASKEELIAEAKRLLSNLPVDILEKDKNITADILRSGSGSKLGPEKIKAAQAKADDLGKRAEVLKNAEEQLAANYEELKKIAAKIDDVIEAKATKQAVFAAQNGTEDIKGNKNLADALETEASKNKAEDAKREKAKEQQKAANEALGASAGNVANLLPDSVGKNRLKAAAAKVEAGDMGALQQVLDLSRLLVERVEKSTTLGQRQSKEIADLRRRLNNQRSNDNSGE